VRHTPTCHNTWKERGAPSKVGNLGFPRHQEYILTEKPVHYTHRVCNVLEGDVRMPVVLITGTALEVPLRLRETCTCTKVIKFWVGHDKAQRSAHLRWTRIGTSEAAVTFSVIPLASYFSQQVFYIVTGIRCRRTETTKYASELCVYSSWATTSYKSETITVPRLHWLGVFMEEEWHPVTGWRWSNLWVI
jgi:hypothetical protein